MTRYASDEARGELVAVWEAGYGAIAAQVAPLPDYLPDCERRARGPNSASTSTLRDGGATERNQDVNTTGNTTHRHQPRGAALGAGFHLHAHATPPRWSEPSDSHGSLSCSETLFQEAGAGNRTPSCEKIPRASLLPQRSTITSFSNLAT
jgi:hypothetical protein